MKIIKPFKEDINNLLKEIQGHMGEQMRKLNTVIQDPKVEVETMKKTQMEANMEMENPGTTEASITNIIQEIEERISGVEDTIEEID